MNVKLHRGHFDLNTQLSVDSTNLGLFGKSGTGKSTVLGLIAGTIQPQSGYIALNGKILYDSRKAIMMPREQRPVGAVLQSDGIDSNETIKTILTTAYNRTLKQRRVFKLNFLIALLELEAVLDYTIDQLSVGERQRVALARSLLKSPQLLLLDETFAAIGNDYRIQLLPILKRLQRELDLPVLYASQSLGEILQLTDQLAVLEQGKVLRNGSLREIAQQGALHYLGIRQLDNILSVTVRRHDREAGCSLASSFGLPLVLPLRPHLAISEQTQISIRANDIALSRHYINGISIQNQIKGRICALIPNGESLIVQVDCGDTLLAEITLGAYKDMGLQEGDIVYCLIKTHAIAYLAEFDFQSSQQIISHDNRLYSLDKFSLSAL
jgi:molybdate transport system ATP-binding protein